MKILVANRHLSGLGGSETFTYTLIAELVRLGHQVEYYTLFKGITSEKIESLGVRFSTGRHYELILAAQIDTITALREWKYTGPLIQICHGAVTPGEQPHPEADGYIAISEEVKNHLQKKGIEAPVILNGIDCRRFNITRRPGKKLKVIASLAQSNEANEIIAEAAAQVDAKVIVLNKYTDKIWEVEKEINKADLVISLGRGCYEGMACGRPVVVFDKRRYQPQLGDGYVTPQNFPEMVSHNCSGRWKEWHMNVDDLVNELQKYSASDSRAMREIAVSQLNIQYQTEKILDYARLFMDHYLYPGAVDVVYVLGKGSTWGDNEIRFSIRSFHKYFRDLRNVVVVGERPYFLSGVVHIPYPDRDGVNKDARMMLKILAACKDDRVSENFVLCTDDTLLLTPLSFSDFTGWHEGPILYNAEVDLRDHKKAVKNEQVQTPSDWFQFVYNTGMELQKRGLPDNNYDKAHSPQPINKAEFISILSEWDMINNHYTISNIYNNSSKIFQGRRISGKNLKVYGHANLSQLDDLASEKICMNYNDRALNDDFKTWLYKSLPDPSPFEVFVTDPSRRVAVQRWFEMGCDYDAGVVIFSHFAPKNQRLIRYFTLKKGDENSQKKLKNTLRLWLL